MLGVQERRTGSPERGMGVLVTKILIVYRCY